MANQLRKLFATLLSLLGLIIFLPPVFSQEENEPVDCSGFTMEVVLDNVQCFGEHNGRIEVNITGGGTDPFQFSIDDGSTYTSNNIFENLPKGLYKVSALDANSCELVDEVEIIEPLPGTIELGPNMVIESNAEVTLDAGSGYAEYIWSTGSMEQTIVFSMEVDSTTVEEIYVEVINEDGCAIQSKPIKITITASQSPADSMQVNPVEELPIVENEEE